jgi:hypothetical protein
MSTTTFKAVQTISGDDIGRTVRFYTWDARREIAVVTTAELRQVSHNADYTTLIHGTLAEREESFQNGETVSFDPPADYNDVAELRERLRDHYGITEDIL